MTALKRRQTITIRAVAVREMFARKQIDCRLISIGDDGFAIAYGSSQDMSEMIEEVYLKWPDVFSVCCLPIGGSPSINVKFHSDSEFQEC